MLNMNRSTGLFSKRIKIKVHSSLLMKDDIIKLQRDYTELKHG